MTDTVDLQSPPASDPVVGEQRFPASGYWRAYWPWSGTAAALLVVAAAVPPLVGVAAVVLLLSAALHRRRVRWVAVTADHVSWQVGRRVAQKPWAEAAAVERVPAPSGSPDRESLAVLFRDGDGFHVLANQIVGYTDLAAAVCAAVDRLAAGTHIDAASGDTGRLPPLKKTG